MNPRIPLQCPHCKQVFDIHDDSIAAHQHGFAEAKRQGAVEALTELAAWFDAPDIRQRQFFGYEVAEKSARMADERGKEAGK